jgi:hypothetical protein
MLRNRKYGMTHTQGGKKSEWKLPMRGPRYWTYQIIIAVITAMFRELKEAKLKGTREGIMAMSH